MMAHLPCPSGECDCHRSFQILCFLFLRKVREATIGLEEETAEMFATPQSNNRDRIDQRQVNR